MPRQIIRTRKAGRVAEYDVVVVGSGIAGMSAALAAAESGFSVAVFEKDKALGGGTGWSHGSFWIGRNHIAKANGHRDSLKAVLEYLLFVGGGATEEANLRAFAHYSPAAARFFERCGVKLQLTRGFPDHYFPAGPGSTSFGRLLEPQPISIFDLGSWQDKIRESELDPARITVEEYIAMGGTNNRRNLDRDLIAERARKGIRTRGPAAIAHFAKALLKRNAPIFIRSAVTELLRENGRVTGVCIGDGRQIQANRGVVLATGGWEADPGLTKAYEGLPGWKSMFPQAVDGDGLRLASDCGAAVTLIRNNLALLLGFSVPSRTAGKEPEFWLSSNYELLYPHTIVVNSRGERFADESYIQSAAPALRHFDVWTRQFSNLPCFLIFDSQYVRNFSFCGGEPGTMPPPWVAKGRSLTELAGKLKIAPAGLKATVNRFNGFARRGTDLDFHRGEKRWTLASRQAIRTGNTKNRSLGTIEVSPFYGVRLSPSAFASGGIRTSAHGQALNVYGKPIPGLYAVGNVAAHTEYGIGYQAGYSLASAMTFGYLSIRHMKHGVSKLKKR